MQKSKINIIAPLLLLTACNAAVLEPQNMGSIALSLSSDIEVEAETKAGEMDCRGFTVFINGTTLVGNTYSETCTYATMTGKVPYGTYVLSAESCNEEKAHSENSNFGCARYTGESTEVQVRSEETVPVSITCHMVNTKASIYLDESFTKDFTNITATLTVGNRTVTVMDPQNTTDGKEAYFNIPEGSESVNLVYRIEGTIAGKELVYTNASSATPMTLSRAQWAKITIKSNHNGIIGRPDIGVDGSMGENTVTEIINPENGSEITDGNLNLPSIIVNTSVNDVEVIECELDVN